MVHFELKIMSLVIQNHQSTFYLCHLQLDLGVSGHQDTPGSPPMFVGTIIRKNYNDR